ncbi:UPF0149 family protein [Pelodictyon phaeoclathratiforme]|jgi:uncharacterized protein|uniref:YecA family protein n=1 Tax=Pelodictyon phaeoclathratiforme (strain DSM 5477 / BU-1) TaxID=324925 RepID=B4SD50_PELPB|nr:UPF0149 family protein [Pelodictyon phaeoclathratiforme]ACF44309.1 yecA family protein [Pelodictyon phaeoclathratiforme BU-1]MBV5289954.1 YecA family protein [Pelodictyon phaeoclathratiforme]
MNPSDSLWQPLSDEELGRLETFLASDATPDDCLFSLEMLDGYMTALVVGPEVVQPEVWIPFIWDQENDNEPSFSSEAEAIEIEELLVRHMNSIDRQFDEDPDEFFPVFEQFGYADEEEKRVAVENWSLGFTVGMELAHASWTSFMEDEETSQFVLPIFLLAKITDDFEELTEEEMDNMALLMPEFIIKIYEYLHQA